MSAIKEIFHAFSGWKFMKSNEYFFHNLREKPLQLRTSSEIGTEEAVCIALEEDSMSQSPLLLCIYFGDELLIYTRHWDNLCDSNYFAIQQQSNTDDRMWVILKTPTSFQISGDDFEQLNIDFVDLDCGSIAESSNFGWLKFLTNLEDPSTAYYLEYKGKHYCYSQTNVSL